MADFRRTKAAILAERQQRTMAVRLYELVSREEASYRHDIAHEHRVTLNRMHKDYTGGKLVIGYRLQAAGAREAPVKIRGEELLPGRQVPKFAQRLQKAGNMYAVGGIRTRGTLLKAAHYHHRAPDPNTVVTVLPPIAPYPLRLIAVKETAARDELILQEANVRGVIQHHFDDVRSETKTREERHLARLQGLEELMRKLEARNKEASPSPKKTSPRKSESPSPQPVRQQKKSKTRVSAKKNSPRAEKKKSSKSRDRSAEKSPESSPVKSEAATATSPSQERAAASPPPEETKASPRPAVDDDTANESGNVPLSEQKTADSPPAEEANPQEEPVAESNPEAAESSADNKNPEGDKKKDETDAATEETPAHQPETEKGAEESATANEAETEDKNGTGEQPADESPSTAEEAAAEKEDQPADAKNEDAPQDGSEQNEPEGPADTSDLPQEASPDDTNANGEEKEQLEEATPKEAEGEKKEEELAADAPPQDEAQPLEGDGSAQDATSAEEEAPTKDSTPAPPPTTTLKILRCCGLTDEDAFGGNDPYVVVKNAATSEELYRTSTKDDAGDSAEWKNANVVIPDGVTSLEVEIWDEDSGTDDLIGSAQVTTAPSTLHRQLVVVHKESGVTSGTLVIAWEVQ